MKEMAVSTYHRIMRTEERQYRAEMEQAIEADAIIHLLTERSYYAARRPSYAILPGMQAHYPNPNYPVPALLLPGVRFARPPKNTTTSAFEMIFGKKVVNSKFALPAGRKPAPTVLQQYNELVINGDFDEVNRLVKVVGADGTDEADEAVDAGADETFAATTKKVSPIDTITSGTCYYLGTTHQLCDKFSRLFMLEIIQLYFHLYLQTPPPWRRRWQQTGLRMPKQQTPVLPRSMDPATAVPQRSAATRFSSPSAVPPQKCTWGGEDYIRRLPAWRSTLIACARRHCGRWKRTLHEKRRWTAAIPLLPTPSRCAQRLCRARTSHNDWSTGSLRRRKPIG